MTAAYQVEVVERTDLLVLTLRCEWCDCASVFNVEKTRLPLTCASCGREISDNVRDALAALVRFLREARTAEENAHKTVFTFQAQQVRLRKPGDEQGA